MILSVYHELKKISAQKKHYIILLGFLFLMILSVLGFRHIRGAVERDMMHALSNVPLLKMMVTNPAVLCDGLLFSRFAAFFIFFCVMPIFSFMFAGEIIASEQQENTLKAYLSRGFSRTKLVLAKFIAVYIEIAFYSFLFSLASLLVGIAFFGFSKMQCTMYFSAPDPGFGGGRMIGLVTAKQAILGYFGSVLYATFALSSISSVSFMISAFVKRMSVATAGGMVFFFASLIFQIVFSQIAQDLSPFLVTRALGGYALPYAAEMNWMALGEYVAVMCLYSTVCVTIPIIVLNLKEY